MYVGRYSKIVDETYQVLDKEEKIKVCEGFMYIIKRTRTHITPHIDKQVVVMEKCSKDMHRKNLKVDYFYLSI